MKAQPVNNTATLIEKTKSLLLTFAAYVAISLVAAGAHVALTLLLTGQMDATPTLSAFVVVLDAFITLTVYFVIKPLVNNKKWLALMLIIHYVVNITLYAEMIIVSQVLEFLFFCLLAKFALHDKRAK
jgi:hypothetical protein